MLLLLILLIIIIGARVYGGAETHLNTGIMVPQKEYLSNIKNGQLILKKAPRTMDKNKLYSFPYIKYYCPVAHLFEAYGEIKKEKIELSNAPYTVDGIQVAAKFFDENITITEKHRGRYFTMLVDYFQEDCRLRCQRVNAETVFMNYFNKNIKKIEAAVKNKGAITYPNFTDVVFKMYEPCSEFNPVWLTNMIPLFEKHSGPIKNMLDMSAGRGARMIACAALDINYLGIDPSEYAHANYGLMKKFVRYCGARAKINFIKSGFEENWKMPAGFKKFDLMFSSPPYFDLEIYENTPGQSIKKFPNMEDWMENFLKKSMTKSLRLLRSGGIMAINIDNPTHIKRDYVNPMLGFEFDDARFVGVIRIHRGAKFHTWCWQKN